MNTENMKTTAKHTPGPWRIVDQMLKEDDSGPVEKCGMAVCPHCHKTTYENPASIQIVVKGWGIAQLGSFDPKHEHQQHLANARLIASAPELLEASQNALFYLRDRAPKEYEQLRRAIAKAIE